MKFISLSFQSSAKKCLGLIGCFLCLIFLVNSNPIRRRRVHLSLSPNDTSSVKHQNDAVDDRNLQFKYQKDLVKQNILNYQNLTIEESVDLGNSSSSSVHGPELAPDGSLQDKVGQLPLLAPIKVKDDNDAFKNAILSDVMVTSDYLQTRNQEQGIAVGVGALNTDIPAANKIHPVHHQEPGHLLDVDAAGQNHPRRKKSKRSTKAVDQTIAVDKQDEEVLNPMQGQLPSQARKHSLDETRGEKMPLEPIKPQQGRIMQGLNNPQDNENQAKQGAKDLPVDKDNLKFVKHVIDTAKEPVKLAELNPPDHMQGIRMEKDGHLNRDYRKEVFLGHHEEFEWTDEEKVSAKLKSIFRRANKNGDHFLDENEIQNWIALNIRIHLQDAVKENAKVFRHLDADKDGFVSWTEFYLHFLIAKGYIISSKDATSNLSLEFEDNERILKYKYRWSEADRNLDDGKLNVKELMDFRHPEQSERMISELIKDLINSLDRDGNGVISEKEFIALPNNMDAEPLLPLEETWQDERRTEFQDVIDLNKDGNANMDELKIYFDPNNLNHARLEAQNLIKMADSDSDGKLTIEEVLDNTDLFIGSKMVDAKRKLHDEF